MRGEEEKDRGCSFFGVCACVTYVCSAAKGVWWGEMEEEDSAKNCSLTRHPGFHRSLRVSTSPSLLDPRSLILLFTATRLTTLPTYRPT